MYPKASGRGIKASNLMKALCQLAGIQDVGIKIQVPVIEYFMERSHFARALQDIVITSKRLYVHAERQVCLHDFLVMAPLDDALQGSRNLRNSVQALFKAFDQMQTRVDEDSVDSKPYPELPPRYRMEKPVPPQIPGMENFDWDNLIDKVLVEAAPAQLEAQEAQEQQAATA